MRRFEHRRPLDVADAVGTMRDRDPVHHDQRHDLLEADRHHRQIVAAEPQRGHAQKRAHHQRDAGAHRERNPEIQMQVGRPESDCIRAEAEEGGLREVDLPAEAEHDRQAEDRDRKSGRLDEYVDRVVVHRQQARDGDRERRKRRVSDGARDSPSIRRSNRHDYAFSATRSPKMPCGRKIRNATSTRNAKPSLYGTET